MSVKEGPLTGGTATTITGTGFTPTSSVSFGGVKAKASTYVSPTELNVESPAGTGTVNVTVETPGGTSTTSAADDFTYVSTPTVTKVTPDEGPQAGNTKVTIEGTGFTGATAVSFGATSALKYKVESPTSISAESPGGTGTVNVTVEGPGGTSATSTADDYTYDPVSTVTSLSVKEGPLTGGTATTITGTGFTPTSSVSFGGVKAKATTYVSTTELSVESPAGTGTVNVTVETAGGTSATSAADDFTYVSTPTVSKLTPAEGPEAGKTTVTIEGTGLGTVTAVSFGGTPASEFKANSATSVTAAAPAGKGTVAVTVEGPGGASAETTADLYAYDPVPTVTGVNPAEGPLGGGTKTTITGTGFTPATKVSFGGIAAKASTFISATELSVESPAGTGTVNVTVESAGGTSAVSTADEYTYVSTPTIGKIRPAEGPEAGGIEVTIEGSGFTGVTAVRFGTVEATSFKLESDATIVAVSPAGTGTANITVQSGGGTSNTVGADLFTYDPIPTVTALSTTQGSAAGGTEVIITGTGFTKESTVYFGKTEATSVTYVSPTELKAVTPAGTGAVSVTVLTPGGETRTSAPNEFTYEAVQSNVKAPAGEGSSTTTTTTTTTTGNPSAQSTNVPPPVLTKTGNVAPVSGDVLVRLPGKRDYVLLSSLEQIPFGSVIDADNGAVTITTALPDGKTQTGEFFDGEFTLTQGRNGNVVVVLYGGEFSVCPTAGERSHVASASANHASPKHVVRKLWANAHGSFSTKGNYAAGAVQGTEWLTEDLCEGTLIRVIRDKVKVTNLVTGKVYEVVTGHSYLAKAPKGHRKGQHN